MAFISVKRINKHTLWISFSKNQKIEGKSPIGWSDFLEKMIGHLASCFRTPIPKFHNLILLLFMYFLASVGGYQLPITEPKSPITPMPKTYYLTECCPIITHNHLQIKNKTIISRFSPHNLFRALLLQLQLQLKIQLL